MKSLHSMVWLTLVLGCLASVASRASAQEAKELGPLQSLTLETGRTTDGSFTLAGRDSWQQLLVTGRYAKGLRDLTGTVTYETVPPGIVAVDDSGLVTPLKPGQAILRARGPGGLTVAAKVAVTHFAKDLPVNFANQIVPIFTRFGCNAGGCHGKAGGQNGFALSLLGFEPAEDYEFLVKEGRGRRLFLAAPESSLLLRKATGAAAARWREKAGPRFGPLSLVAPLDRAGTRRGHKDDPVVTRLEVLPQQRLLPRGGRQQLVVIAHRSDGSTEDVTRLAQFEANEPTLAEVSPSGLVAAKTLPGTLAVMARFQTHVAVFRAQVPLGPPVEQLPPVKNFIDTLVWKQLKVLGIPPSAVAPDATFIRRVTLDLAGRLPTLEETRQFLADKTPDRHERLVDRLLASEDYAYYFAAKWNAVLRNRRPNPGDDLKPNVLFHTWIKDILHQNKPFDQFARELLTAAGEVGKDAPVLWYREVNEPAAQVEDVAQLFWGNASVAPSVITTPSRSGVRTITMAWSPSFPESTIKVPPVVKKGKGPAIKLPTTVRHLPGIAQAVNPRSKQAVQAVWARRPTGDGGRGSGSARQTGGLDGVPRQSVLCPHVGQSLLEALFRSRSGRGGRRSARHQSADQPRTARCPGPAFHRPQVRFEGLGAHALHGQVYRLSAVPNGHNADDRQNFSHFYLRRLPAEVLLDALDTVTGSKTVYKGLPQGTRAVQLPDNQFPSYFLSIFGRPDSASPCECERNGDANLAQSLYLSNSEELLEKIRGKVKAPTKNPGKTKPKNPPKAAPTAVTNGTVGGRVKELLKDQRPDREKLRDLYLLALSREPTTEELTALESYLEGRHADRAGAYEDILWAVINTKEFLFNH